MQDLLNIAPVDFHMWLILLAVSSLIFVVMEIFKFVKFRLVKSFGLDAAVI